MPQETLIRLRLTARDARAETGQVDTTRLLELFQDAATELCIRQVGDEGILRTYTTVEFLGPLRVGDYVEVRGRLADQGRKTCTIDLVAHKVVRAARTLAAPLAGEALDPPRLIARASGVWLVPERVPVETAAEAAADVETLDEDIATMPAEGAGEAAEGQTEPMSWGGHRPGDRPAPRRRPGPDVRLREEEAETPPPRREREERGGEWERRPAEERREWRPREERDRSGGQRRWEDRQPRREGQERGRDERPRGRDEGGRGRDERRGEDRPPRDRSYGDRPRGGGSDRSASDRPRGDRPYGDRPRGSGDRPYGDRSRGAEERARGGDRPGSGPRRRRE
ncbi:MAG: hypothetical protein KIT87_23240 [Anaerolineae bacterium]|nr:hypothetical protein [Anaerolineae bacterium]